MRLEDMTAEQLRDAGLKAVVSVIGEREDPCTGASRGRGQVRVGREVARKLLALQEEDAIHGRDAEIFAKEREHADRRVAQELSAEEDRLAAEFALILEGYERFLGRLSPSSRAFVERKGAVMFGVYTAGWGAGRAGHAAGPPDVWCAWLEADDHLRPWAGWASWSDEGERYVAIDNKLNAAAWRTRAEAAEVGTPVPVYFAALRHAAADKELL